MVGRIFVGLALAVAMAFAVGCDSKESSAEDDDGDTTKDDSCRIETTLSGGVEKRFGDEAPACGYTARTVSFILATSEPALSILLSIDDFEAGKTGTFAASIDVNQGSERWRDATCSVDIDSNVKTESAADGGAMFDRYLIKGSGSCSTLATFSGIAGGKAPVTIAPFTFVAPMLFY